MSAAFEILRATLSARRQFLPPLDIDATAEELAHEFSTLEFAPIGHDGNGVLVHGLPAKLGFVEFAHSRIGTMEAAARG